MLAATADYYKRAARGETVIDGSNVCCAPGEDAADVAKLLGYSAEDLQLAPQSTNMGLGCGNPRRFAKLQPGETVMDLGCGAGFDMFLCAREVSPDEGNVGRVIGVDMTPEMLRRGREAVASSADALLEKTLDFRLGELDHLPCGDALVDAVVSNGVICLCADKGQVCREMHRVLKPGGRVAVCDMVTRDGVTSLPPHLRTATAFAC